MNRRQRIGPTNRIILTSMMCVCAVWGNHHYSAARIDSKTLQTEVQQRGQASFYSRRATGARTANGERLHHDSLTCAHRSYPFGTMLKVTNLINGRQVIVRVNDRGPFRRGRIIDLSWGAAKAIGMISQGIAPVTVERLRQTNIPYKPEADDTELPLFDFELADIAPTGITPVWQQDSILNHKRTVRSIRQTVSRLKQDSLATNQ